VKKIGEKISSLSTRSSKKMSKEDRKRAEEGVAPKELNLARKEEKKRKSDQSNADSHESLEEPTVPTSTKT
jgi:hypothetical protein